MAEVVLDLVELVVVVVELVAVGVKICGGSRGRDDGGGREGMIVDLVFESLPEEYFSFVYHFEKLFICLQNSWLVSNMQQEREVRKKLYFL